MWMYQGNGVITDFTGGIRSGFFSSMEGSDAPSPRVEGVRVRCLHCPSYNLCLPCLAQHGPDHDAEDEWPGRAVAPHVFEVLHRPVPP